LSQERGMQRQQSKPCLCAVLEGLAFNLSLHRALPCLPSKPPTAMERKAQSENRGPNVVDPINMMQIRMLKTDASPMKKRLAAACSHGMDYSGFDVTLHIYDLGPLSKWLLNYWNAKKSGLGAFHCGIEVLGVEWSFQAMIDCEIEEMTGVMCHKPKSHPRHVYRESINLGGSPLCANEICNVLARLEKDWPARSYHFLNHNCTDFAEALAQSLNVPTPFPRWAHGLAKGLLKQDGKDNTLQAPWWLPAALNGCCGSCASKSCGPSEANAKAKLSCSTSILPGCDELVMAPKTQQAAYPAA
jgi:hypothetical protein